MNQQKQPTDLDLGRELLNRARTVLAALGEDSSSESVAYAHATAMIGHGFVALAHTERSFEAMDQSALVAARQLAAFTALSEAADDVAESTTLGAAVEREQRAAAEARPHDDDAKHALDEDVLWVVADNEGPIHAGTQAAAQKWADENRDDYEGLTVTAMEVDRG